MTAHQLTASRAVPADVNLSEADPGACPAPAVPPPTVRSTGRRLALRMRRCREAAEAGMSTAEYAVGTIAACAFAAVLYKIVTSGPVRSALTALIEKALHAPF
jgi:hypothetical protein